MLATAASLRRQRARPTQLPYRTAQPRHAQQRACWPIADQAPGSKVGWAAEVPARARRPTAGRVGSRVRCGEGCCGHRRGASQPRSSRCQGEKWEGLC